MATTIANVREGGDSQMFEQVLGQLQTSVQAPNRARVLGLTGCRSGDGVSYVLGKLAGLLAARSHKRVLEADCLDLSKASQLPPDELLDRCCYTDQPGRWRLSCTTATGAARVRAVTPEGDARRAISVLDSRFDFILLDCGAVTSSGRLWQLAPLLDDLLLVVAAGETKHSQVLYAQRIIAQSGAHLSGCLLNKRTYPLPGPIHRMLS